MLKLVYISSKRSRERLLLETLKSIRCREVQLHVSSSFTGYLCSLRTLASVFFRYRPQCALFEGVGVSALPALLLCWLLRTPYFVRLKGDIWSEYEERKLAPRSSLRLAKEINFRVASHALEHAAGVIPISNHLDREFRSRVKNRQSYVVAIPWDQELWKAASEQACNIQGDSRALVLTVTNFNFWRKVEPLIEAVPCLYPAIADMGAKWVIAGGGTYWDRARTMLSEYQDLLIGQVDKATLINLYRNTTLLLYISGLDGLPNVLLEGALFRLPIVINRDCPAVEFLNGQDLGVVVDLERMDSCKRELHRLLNDVELRKQLGDNAYQHAMANYSACTVGKALEVALNSALSELGSPYNRST